MQRGINVRTDKIIRGNLLDQTAVAMLSKEQRYAKLQTMATHYLKSGNICSDIHTPLSKLNYVQNSLRQQFDNPDKKLTEDPADDPVNTIAQSAMRGSWVLISTIRFPQFRKRLCERLEQLRAADEIHDQFRLIVDLQGYAANDISDSFLFDEAISFHMTEQNTEEFEGFDDIWSAILDERVLVKLGEKIDTQRDKLLKQQEDSRPRAKDDEPSDDMMTSQSSQRKDAEPESPSNFKLIDNTIKSEVQKSLYKQFMNESKIENQGLKFDLMRAQEPSEESEELVPEVQPEEEQKNLEEEVKEDPTTSRSGNLQ